MSGPIGRQRQPRIGVLVVTYNAATTLAQTLDRLPESFRSTLDHVLLSDDASQDNTYEVGLEYSKRSDLPITVVKHPKNLGYGGNQKAGYAWAMSHGLDVVVLLHGDGQYAPEVIEDLVDPIVLGEADAVFGSRMMVAGHARAGGMPLYKYVGNRVLSTFQNRLTDLQLTEWHSGYRAYRVDALRELPLESYTDDFDFDTEIILGLHSHEMRIVEVPIPTYYGDEICYVNGLKYARDVAKDVVSYRLARMGFGHGHTGVDEQSYEVKPSPHSSHGRLLSWLETLPPSTILDVGCSDGRFSALARQAGHEVHGMDLIKHDGIAERVSVFFEADLNAGLPAELPRGYDVIVAADVLEHVVDPESLLTSLAERLADGGEILVSVPNFGHWYPRGRTTLGWFDYDTRGPLDHGHVRFFTRRSFERLIERCELSIEERSVVGVPVDIVDRGGSAPRTLSRLLHTTVLADRALARTWPTMFGYQLLYRLRRS